MSTDGSMAQTRDRERAQDRSKLLWHSGFFVVVNVFLWVQDFVMGDGLDWAYLTTIVWGIGLTIHALVYVIAGRRSHR